MVSKFRFRTFWPRSASEDSDTHRIQTPTDLRIQTPTDLGFRDPQTWEGAIGQRRDSRPSVGALKRGLLSRPRFVCDRLGCEGKRVVLWDSAPR
jgi:hypothetical protein